MTLLQNREELGIHLSCGTFTLPQLLASYPLLASGQVSNVSLLVSQETMLSIKVT